MSQQYIQEVVELLKEKVPNCGQKEDVDLEFSQEKIQEESKTLRVRMKNDLFWRVFVRNWSRAVASGTHENHHELKIS